MILDLLCLPLQHKQQTIIVMKIENFYLYNFCGFYGTIFDLTDAEFRAIEMEESARNIELNETDFNFKYKEYMNDVADMFVRCWSEPLIAVGILKSYKNVYIESPREYNFSTDKIFMDIELADNWQDVIKTFIQSNYEKLSKEIFDDWSDRPGFWSFTDNNIDNWYNYLFDEAQFDDKYLHLILYYFLKYEGYNFMKSFPMFDYEDFFEEIECFVTENIYESEYIEFTETGQKKVDSAENECRS